jgi:hypothetical protein
MADVVIVNAQTGEVTEREMTPEELSQRLIDEAQALAAAEMDAGVNSNRTTLTDRAAAALAVNRAYIANPAPTTAESIAQVKALTRQNTAVIRLLLGLLEEVD